MIRAKYSPGPWFQKATKRREDGTVVIPIRSSDLTCICEVRWIESPEELNTGMANSSLVAAAPELLEALRLVLPLAEAYSHGSAADTEMHIRLARRAIAKADA